MERYFIKIIKQVFTDKSSKTFLYIGDEKTFEKIKISQAEAKKLNKLGIKTETF